MPIWAEFMKKAVTLPQYSDMSLFRSHPASWTCNSTRPLICWPLPPAHRLTMWHLLREPSRSRDLPTRPRECEGFFTRVRAGRERKPSSASSRSRGGRATHQRHHRGAQEEKKVSLARLQVSLRTTNRLTHRRLSRQIVAVPAPSRRAQPVRPPSSGVDLTGRQLLLFLLSSALCTSPSFSFAGPPRHKLTRRNKFGQSAANAPGRSSGGNSMVADSKSEATLSAPKKPIWTRWIITGPRSPKNPTMPNSTIKSASPNFSFRVLTKPARTLNWRSRMIASLLMPAIT